MLCDRCAAVFQNPKISISPFHLRQRFDDDDLQVLHPNFASLEAAIKERCGFCHRISHALSSKGDSQIFTDFQLSPDVDPDSFSIRYRLVYESDNGKVVSYMAVCLAQRADEELREHCSEYLVISPEQVPLTGESVIETENGSTTASINTITSWIENCNRNHSLCSREEGPRLNHQFARILDVGDVPDAPEVKLCLPKNLKFDTKYVTLSHCWGGITSEPPSLTTATYDEYLQRITVADLPQAFQDAIQLTRKLGIRYFWTESLCIIQDCPKDWLDQAGVMGEVYQGSYLNIAADISLDPNGGLFTIRNSVLATPLRISVRGNISQDDLPPLRLEGASLFVAEATPQVLETEIDLNTRLGNRDGNFDLKDKDFAFTARSVELVETTLYAELRTISGEWRCRCVDVRELLEGPSDRSSFRLVGGSTLFISEPQEIDLNECLANRDGAVNADGTDFAFTARNISLDGSTLRAELRKINGEWRQDSIDLASCVSWSSGRLRPKKFVETFYDVVTDGYAKRSKQTLESKSNAKEWVFQESLLAPRLVHFMDRQLIWECTTSKTLDERSNEKSDDRQGVIKWSEPEDPYSVNLLHEPKTRELGLDYIWSSLRAMHGRSKFTFRRKTLSQNSDLLRQAKQMCYGESEFETTHSLIKYWSDIAVNHSAAYPRQIDRLIAVAGLAKILSTRTSFRYVAGLWEVQLPRQLLWTPSHLKEMPTEKSTAPSWSWASYPGGITDRGIKPGPILETNGVMDLVKCLSIDIEGLSEKDDMPFGQVKDGRLLVRGRLLPISLDLSVWPEGATREDTLVQSWTGSTSEAPCGETFLVPILFTCCDDGFSDSIPNSLLLESTEEKGVFHRIGTARLRDCCDLKNITPQLYTAEYIDHEFEDDDESEASAEDDGFVIIPTPDAVKPNPQQDASNNATSHHASNDTQYTFLDEASEIATERETDPDSERTMTPEEIISSTEREISRWNTLFPKLPKTEEEFEIDINTDELEREMMGFYNNDSARSSRTRTQAGHKRKVQKLTPKDAIAGHYYIGYIEDDKDTNRYGHFVFEIR
ncbi:uncharacterized protein ACHE_10223S [Aspergillus chevalieri]|uniref:Heterokaryon incompatibility domain-containing protein n=1 Tax=Aspergillus chevalieri TaxID=182096 RepID=A0A7R7ZIZ6_ASPCH|nr:uncharacterized protein ACHE_10223S [Aspergillus chevalieri]BCR82821.1 hypothetical protein ACHE_10223S [Aspergillus chevalieri]